MDFNDSPEDAAFRAEARTFFASVANRRSGDELDALRAFAERSDEFQFIAEQQRWQKKLYDAGWGCVTWPKAYGGRDATPTQALIFSEEISRYEIPPMLAFQIGHGMIAPTILAHGTEEQRRHIPRLLDGSEIWCQLWSEPNAGSDLASLETRAERDSSGDWRIRGQKVWTTGAQFARWGLCLVRTDPDVPKHKGLSVFIVDMKAPEITVRPLREITGNAEFSEVFIDDVRVPAENLVGEVNDGWRVATTTLMNERYAVGLGGGASAWTRPLIALAQKTTVNGEVALESSLVRQRLADAFVLEKLVTLTGYRALTKIARGGIPGPEGSILKLAKAALLSRVVDVGSRMLGMPGVLQGSEAPDEGLWAACSVGAVGMHIGGGTDEVMRNIIGERVLGLAKEPRADAGISFREAKARLAR